MKNNILKALSNNLGFKILAFIFAVTLWLTVYNIEDPTKSKTLTINVTIANKEYVESLGKYYEIQDGTNKVSFSVTAARSVLDKLDESDFTATANMEYLTLSDDESEGVVPIEIICTNANANSVRLSSTTKTLKVRLDDLMTKQFVVTANATGEVAEGYALGQVEVTAPNVLQISGPKSIVEDIKSVIATIDVTGMSDTWTTYRTTPTLYNEDGKVIDTTRLTFSDETVNVSAEILNMKDVPIVVKTTGTPAGGYEITSISCEPTTVKLKGSKALLNTITEITVPEGVISVEGAESSIKTTIDISEYIPEGTQLADVEMASVEVSIGIGKLKEKTFNLKTENITVTGLPTDGKIKFALESVAVTISGLEEDVNALSNENLEGTIDVTGLKGGVHQVGLVLDLDETKYMYKEIKVKVSIEDSVLTGATSTGTKDERTQDTESSESTEGTEEAESTERSEAIEVEKQN